MGAEANGRFGHQPPFQDLPRKGLNWSAQASFVRILGG